MEEEGGEIGELIYLKWEELFRKIGRIIDQQDLFKIPNKSAIVWKCSRGQS